MESRYSLVIGYILLIVAFVVDGLYGNFRNIIFLLGLFGATKFLLRSRVQILKCSHDFTYNDALCKISGISYGVIVASVVFILENIRNQTCVAICISLFAYYVNYTTGYSFALIVKYVSYLCTKIKQTILTVLYAESESFMYVKRLHDKLLWIVVLYTVISQVSIVFSALEINIVVYLYALFALIIIAGIKVWFEISLIKESRELVATEFLEINKRIVHEYAEFKNTSDCEKNINRIENLVRMKSFVKQNMYSFDYLEKFISSIGMLVSILLPVLLQELLTGFNG